MPIKNLLTDAITRLNSNEGAIEAQLLLQHLLNVNRAWLIAHESDALGANIHEAYRALINRRLGGEPIAYILGYREFYGLNLKVTAATLIPRPDTETLVEAALAKIDLLLAPSPQPSPTRGEGAKNLKDTHDSSPSPQRGRGVGERGENTLEKTLDSDFRRNDELKILDLGTGSGAIALAIAKHRPNALITAADASQAALNIATENAQNLKITNVNFILSDWFNNLKDQKFDVIVSNPPYIEQNDAHLTQGDLPWEPISALVAGHDGLSDIKRIIQNAAQHLHLHGWLMLEHGYNQAACVADLLKEAGFSQISHVQDLAGITRVTFGRIV